MQIKDLMTRNVEVISPESTLKIAAQKMESLDVGVLPVCDNERLVGMLTDRDIVVRSTAKGDDPNNTKVRDIMSPGVEWCFEDQSIEEVAKQMENRQIRRSPVINHDKNLVGIISLGDLAVRGDEKLAGEALKKISQPAQPKY